jgi:hypothetical protein
MLPACPGPSLILRLGCPARLSAEDDRPTPADNVQSEQRTTMRARHLRRAEEVRLHGPNFHLAAPGHNCRAKARRHNASADLLGLLRRGRDYAGLKIQRHE